MSDYDCDIKLRVKHRPAMSPGNWYNSTLKFKIEGDRLLVMRIEKKIKEAIAEIGSM